jgi:hypothetical protein
MFHLYRRNATILNLSFMLVPYWAREIDDIEKKKEELKRKLKKD